MAGIGAALRSVAQKGAEFARQLTEEAASGLSGFKFHREYKIVAQIGTAGPHSIWRIFAAVSRSPSALVRDVSIWVLDKRQLLAIGGDGETAHLGRSSPQVQQRWEAVLEQQRHSCAVMTRMKHPGVVRVVQPLAETSGHLVLVTEAVRGCLRDLMVAQLQQLQQQQQQREAQDAQSQHSPQHGDLAGSQPGGDGGSGGPAGGGAPAVLTMLEVKLGLLSLVDVLYFLHGTAKMAHCGLAPQSVVVTSDGSWKLAGFCFAVPLLGSPPQGGGAAGAYTATTSQPPYSYADPFPPPWEELAKPQLAYTAPELVVPPGGAAVAGPWDSAHQRPSSAGLLTPDDNPFLPAAPAPLPGWAAADTFSLGALAYEAITVAALADGAPSSRGQWSRPAADVASPPQLLPVRCSLQQYGSRLAALASAGPAPSAAARAGMRAAVGAAGGGGSLGFLTGAGGGGGAGAGVAADLTRVPLELQGVLLALVSPSPVSRPPLTSLARLDWFEADSLLRALRFLEGIVQSDQNHKLAFLADLADEQKASSASSGNSSSADRSATAAGAAPWRRFPDRLLAGRVLPPLLQEVRTGGPVGVSALPVVMAISQRLGRAAFAELVLPQLTPVLEAAGGAPQAAIAAASGPQKPQQYGMLAALVGQAEVLAGLMDGPTIDLMLVPMLLRTVIGSGAAATAGSAQQVAGGEASFVGVGGPLPATSPAVVSMPPQLADPRLALAALVQLRHLVESGLLDGRSAQVRSRLLRPLLAAAARTTSAGVRASCLGLLALLAGKVDRTEGETMLAMCAQLLSIDKSGGTILAVAGVLQSLSGAPTWGPVLAAHSLLPMLVPQLLATSLTPPQLASLSAITQAMLSRVVQYAESAGQTRSDGAFQGALTAANSGFPSNRPMASAAENPAAIDQKDGGGRTMATGVLAFTTWPSGSSCSSSTSSAAKASGGPCSSTTTGGPGAPTTAPPSWSAGQAMQSTAAVVAPIAAGLLHARINESPQGCHVPHRETSVRSAVIIGDARGPQPPSAPGGRGAGTHTLLPNGSVSPPIMRITSAAPAGPSLSPGGVSGANDTFRVTTVTQPQPASAAMAMPTHGFDTLPPYTTLGSRAEPLGQGAKLNPPGPLNLMDS